MCEGGRMTSGHVSPPPTLSGLHRLATRLFQWLSSAQALASSHHLFPSLVILSQPKGDASVVVVCSQYKSVSDSAVF